MITRKFAFGQVFMHRQLFFRLENPLYTLGRNCERLSQSGRPIVLRQIAFCDDAMDTSQYRIRWEAQLLRYVPAHQPRGEYSST
jgi:hypothetical protein